MSVNRREHTEAGQEGHHRSSARAHERQRHADDRQQAGDHAGVDEDVDEERQAQRARKQSAERVLCFGRDPQAAADEREIEHQQQAQAEQPEPS